MEKELICIGCPKGCPLWVQYGSEAVMAVSGNACPRGEAYAKSECIHPTRTLTTTVISENGEPIPVKTSKPIPKEKLFACMELLRGIRVKLPVHVGDVIQADIFGSDIIATANRE